VERDVHVLARARRLVARVLRARIAVVAVRLRDDLAGEIVNLLIERARVRRALVDRRAVRVDAARLQWTARAATREGDRDEDAPDRERASNQRHAAKPGTSI